MLSPYASPVQRYGRNWYRPWLALLALLAVATGLWLLFHRATEHRNVPPVIVENGDPDKAIAAIRRAPRAIVFLDARWSVYAVQGRQYFKEAALRLAESDLRSINFFILDEWPVEDHRQRHKEITQQWLASLELKELPVGHGFGIGAGSLLWLEKGRVVLEGWSAMKLGEAGITKRTRDLWRG
jgi:hypothetical protein